MRTLSLVDHPHDREGGLDVLEGKLTCKAFPQNYAPAEDITTLGVDGTFKDFRGHPRSTPLVVCHHGVLVGDSAEVTNLQHQAVLDEEEIWGFEVSVDEWLWVHGVEVLDTICTLSAPGHCVTCCVLNS